MEAGLIIALCVAIILTLISGILAGLFGGMWWQARKTAEVWEKAYTHVREQLTFIKHDTYNTGAAPPTPPTVPATGGVVKTGAYIVGEKPNGHPALREVDRNTLLPPDDDDPMGLQLKRS